TIYLDFTGHTTTGTYWNSSSRPTITTPAYDVDGNTSSFSNQELRNIYEVWLRVSEDYMPFDVNVTTKEPSSDMLMKSSSSDQTFGVRVCIGGRATDWYISSGTATGVSYVDVFDYSSDLPTFVFSGNCSTIQHIADSVSHETGHSLSLSHDGKGSDEYYFGGDGWGPIMGGAGWQELVQWSHGEYSGATNPQEDDLAEISSRIGYRADDHGDAIANATPLTFTTGEFGAGIIERNTDVDYFSFNLNGEGAVIKVGGIKNVTNLDVKATVYNANGAVVGEYDPTDALYATIDVSNFSPGKYYLKVEGTGKSPVYSDYGSLGAYTIEATSRSIVVNTNEDVVNTADDKISLREALTVYASDGDTITFDSSLKGKTITLKSDLSQIYVNKNITLDASNLYTESTATPGVTVSGGDATRIMYLASGKAMTIKGLKFTHGKSPACGGAIWNSGALTVQDCVFADNDATFKYDDGSDGWYYGGAIAVKPGATINASNCVFSGNKGAGAVAFQTDANSTFENCQFLDNGTYGVYLASGTAQVNVNGSTLSGNTYGIYLRSNDGTLVVSDSEFSSNKYYGVYLYGSGALNVSGSKISGNMYGLYASGATGSVAVVDSEFSSNEYGVYMNGASGSVAVSESVISSNQYGAYVYKGELSLVDTFITSNTRGGIYCLQDGVVDATNVVIADNVANYYGAGVYLIGKATLRNSTIANNSAGYYGGGVYLNNSAVLNVYNSIIVGNSAQYGDKDVYKYGSDARANAWNVLSSYTSWDSGSSQFTYDENLPLFSYVSQGDYSLADSSQAINKGANEHVTTQTDIVGVARIFDETVDLGAYEYGVALSPLTPPTITTTSSTSDSITVKWNAVTNATGYVVEYKSETDANYASMSSTVSTSRTITNLTPGTNYKIRVYALGDGTNNSNSTYSAVKDVKTQSVMLTTPTITTTSSTTSSITIKWNSVENASGYVVAYKKSTDSSYTVMSPTTTTSRTITNLSANTTYNVKLYAQGDGTVYTDSNYSAVKSVATQPVSDVETPSTTVTTDLDVVDPYDGKISLREALVTYSNAGDTVRFATAMKGKTITLDPDRNQLYISRNVTIDASNLYTASTGTPGVTISGGDATRIMYLASGKTMTIKGLKFTHGKSPACGGAIWDSGNLIVQDCVFADNNATFTDDDGSAGLYYGAAIAVKSGATINANRCVFSGNAGAGTISFQTDANSTIKNCQFIDNDTHGVYLAYGAARITVEDSVFTGNEYGVNLYSSSGSIVASNCTLSSNVVGAYVYAGSLSLNGDVITSNTSHGIYGASNGVVEATNVVIANNRGGWGAGIELFGEMTLRNSTVANNVATSGGGGVDLDSSAVLNVYNSIIACNTSPRGADVNKYSSSAQANAWNVISSYTAWDSGANQLTYNENQPLFADAAQGVYSLAENSQAINKGANENVTTQTDLAGNKRIIDGTVDLGAYEYGAVTPTPEPTPLDVPTWKTVSSTANSITVAWNPVDNASRYVVEYKTLRDTSYTVAPSVASTTFTILNLDADTTYYLRV
ncbi:MAG: right-handed parallel beta-helix repeat-containing protein, partial [Thermoguttaceae bacterium]|nr:right-handed parallel beta-helix repeat-containing protein [Thermoguttaceae bacterium]